jgi:hypothetical protein
MPEFDLTGTVQVNVHKRVSAKTLGAAKRKARIDSDPWWYDDIQYDRVTVTGGKEVVPSVPA